MCTVITRKCMLFTHTNICIWREEAEANRGAMHTILCGPDTELMYCAVNWRCHSLRSFTCIFPSHDVWPSSYSKSIFLRSDSSSCAKWHLANGYHFDELIYFSHSFLLWRMLKKSIISWYPFVHVHQFVYTQTTIILNRKWAPFYESIYEITCESTDASVPLSCLAFD